MPARQSPAAGAAGGFNAVQKLLTNPAPRHGAKARRQGTALGTCRLSGDARQRTAW